MMDIQAIRKEFPALRNYIWFQNGGVSITPRCIAAEHARLMQELLDRGPMHIVYPDEEFPRRTATMDRLARFFSVSASELAIMRGVSEAFQTVLRGMSWQAGDEIIMTEDEEAALLLPALHLRDRSGVRVVKLPLLSVAGGQSSPQASYDPELLVESLRSRLTSRTKLVAVSHVTTDLGVRLPIESLCDAARRQGVATFVDLAHSAGLFPIPLRQLGCDFAGLLSYKWMYAPYASGLLFVREENRV